MTRNDDPPPEFSRPFDIRQLDHRAVRLVADASERAALARRFDVVRIDRLEAEVVLEREGEALNAVGTLSADIVQSCAVSATGTGEYFIRLTVAREICALVQYKGLKLQAAADQVIQKELIALGGDGGVIAVAPDGQMAWSFNTSGMYRARIADGQAVTVGIYKDES